MKGASSCMPVLCFLTPFRLPACQPFNIPQTLTLKENNKKIITVCQPQTLWVYSSTLGPPSSSQASDLTRRLSSVTHDS
ncbi:hypothetical protein ATANTOWER_009215 [Ataeniobius toweri]|uniref:Uncharacterized protein n=1 Tax=Ataeniobius toweri TaxID=208326 RepID=A0ABU7AFJ1_9TELE|nr:hypothetical protein [Ataeniobius toweri]